jgi:glyoxylase-like metal-dependent hydrolase (beta-lactamase superfamily II)
MMFDKATFTLTYVVYDEATKDAVIIDPVLNYEQAASKVSYESVESLESFIKDNNLNVHYLLETHAHADHLSGAAELKERFPGSKIAINKNITKVQEIFKDLYNMKDLNPNGEQFDELLDEGQVIIAGSISIEVLFTPGHTPACTTFKIEDNLFTGDALFMPDSGTGRCDFPAGSAKDLFDSISNKIYKFSDDTKIFVGHDYQPNGRELKYQTTVGESKQNNIQLKAQTTENEFTEFRTVRDDSLNAPKLLLPSLQVNIRAGVLPEAEDNKTSYLKIPIRKANKK